MSSGPPTVGRRRFLAGASLLAAGAVAGCMGGGSGDSEDPVLPTEPDYGGWFDNVSNYRNTKDHRNVASTTVRVGVQANNGYLGFGPPAVAVSPDTEVVWDWTGKGGAHNVVESVVGLFDSGDPVRPASTTFSHTFDEPGVFKYVCEPHAGMGMKGAIFVALD